MARRTMAIELSRCAGVKAPISAPFANARTVPDPTNDPTFSDAPRATMKSSHWPKPCGPVKRVARRRLVLSVMRASSLSFTGAGVSPSPRIAVVMPCTTIESTRPLPVMKSSYDCAWMSMNPGATICP